MRRECESHWPGAQRSSERSGPLAQGPSSPVAAHARVALAREQLTAAHELEQSERSRFRLGDSTLLLVNLREQAATDAALQELDALADYHRAKVELRAATGLLGP